MMRRWVWLGLVLLAGLALWLLLTGPVKVLGFDPGKLGMVLLVGTAWISLYAVSRLPNGELEAVVSPGEWRAWVGFGFTLVAIWTAVCLIVHAVQILQGLAAPKGSIQSWLSK